VKTFFYFERHFFRPGKPLPFAKIEIKKSIFKRKLEDPISFHTWGDTMLTTATSNRRQGYKSGSERAGGDYFVIFNIVFLDNQQRPVIFVFFQIGFNELLVFRMLID